MEVEDRHLNVMVDLINAMVDTCEPLKYLSEQFNPSDMVWRLSQLILKYEKSILSESVIREALQMDPNGDGYCLTACSVIKVWLLEYYKHDFVTINELKVENGVEEEIVLTVLMVLRVLYRMRQLMDKRVNQILSKGWKDLQEFDQQLDEKFETKCLKLMSLLVKHSNNYNSKIDSLVAQINGLEEEKKILSEKLKTSEEKYVSNQFRINQSLVKRIAKKKDKNNSPKKPESNASTSQSADTPHKSNTKNSSAVSKSPIRSPNRRAVNISSTSSTTTPLSPKLAKQSNKTTPLSSKRKSLPVTRRSPRITHSSPKANGTETTPQKALREVRELLSETDVSDNNTRKSPEHQSVDLPLKKRKARIVQSPVKSSTGPPNTRKKRTQAPKMQTKFWPSRNKSYPRKKRYPCNWVDCNYIADRPSTLVRHFRAHTGEKPYACDWPGCDKRYKMSSNLTPHKLTHTGEKPYRCVDCQKRFTYPQHLKRHRISHQKNRLQRTQESKVETEFKQDLLEITST